jgi:hypothetical protein
VRFINSFRVVVVGGKNSLRLALPAVGLPEGGSLQQHLSDGQSRLPWTLPAQPDVPIPRRSAVAVPAADASLHFGSITRPVNIIPKRSYVVRYDYDYTPQ